MKTQLEAGDVVYCELYGQWNKHTIERVTVTQAIAGNIKFKRNIVGNGIVYKMGANKWSSERYMIANDENVAKYEKFIIIQSLKHVNFNLLRLEDLQQIKEIIYQATN